MKNGLIYMPRFKWLGNDPWKHRTLNGILFTLSAGGWLPLVWRLFFVPWTFTSVRGREVTRAEVVGL